MLVLTWRRGLPLCAVVALAFPVTYVGRWDQWLGVWSETQNYLGIGFIFGIPAACAGGAWVGAQNARSGIHQLQAGAGIAALRVARRELVEPVLWVWSGFLLGCAPAYLATWITATTGFPRVLPLVAQLTCLAGATALGHLAGTRLPRYLGAPVSAAVAYVVLGFLSFSADRILLSLTPVDERWMTFHHVMWWVLVLQIILWVSVFFALVARRAALPKVSFGALVLAGLAASPLLYVTPATREVTSGSTRMECSTRRDTAICLPRAKSLLEGSLAVETARAEDALDGLLPPGVAFVDDEARGVSASADVSIDETAAEQQTMGREVVFFSRAGDLSARTQLDVNQFHYQFIAALAPVSTSAVESSVVGSSAKPAAQPSDVIQLWYLNELGVPTDGSGGVGAPLLDQSYLDYSEHEQDVRRFDQLNETERAAWFQTNAAAIRGGTLNWSAFAAIGQ